jgi:hypothetical protein
MLTREKGKRAATELIELTDRARNAVTSEKRHGLLYSATLNGHSFFVATREEARR